MHSIAQKHDSIYQKFDRLKRTCKDSDKAEKEQLLQNAFEFVFHAHVKERPVSGEPMMLHLMDEARIVTGEIGLGTKAAVASMLFGGLNNSAGYTVEGIRRLFGNTVANIVAGLTKIPNSFLNQELDLTVDQPEFTVQEQHFRAFLLSISDDIRVVLIHLAKKLYTMRTLGQLSRKQQIAIAGETLYLYAPLSERLGLYKIKSELEDLCLKYLYPQVYDSLAERIKLDKERRTRIINKFAFPIMSRLKTLGIKYQISGRPKSIYSTWNKMQNKGVTFEEVYDLLAIRIVFEPSSMDHEKDECWQIYNIITGLYNSNPDRLRDWVSAPKSNGYEALHVTVMGPEGNWVEVQIRSKRMNEVAERGIAAHYKYKGVNDKEGELDKFIKEVKAHLSSPHNNALDYFDHMQLTLMTPDILVFTPKGHLKTLPKSATVLDFAFEIHTELGYHCIGAKVDFDLVPIDYQLKSGDKVEIITSESQRPSDDWKDLVVTHKAKSAVKSFFKKEARKNIE